MALSKSTRMQILLAINGLFFFIELGVGIWVKSLALVADSFHMLNDVLSLCVGLWAVNVAKSKPRSKTFTYGWQRAETLGALVNGVFLVALCFSIFIEAIQRLVDVPEISNPKWILGVGSAGLVMNIVGLFLFHDHGHSHGHGEENGHAKQRSVNEHGAAEEGFARTTFNNSDIADEDGNIEDALPENRVRSKASKPIDAAPRTTTVSFAQHTNTTGSPSGNKQHKRRRSRGYSSLSEIAVHPASLRNGIIAAGRLDEPESRATSDTEDEAEDIKNGNATGSSERTPLLGSSQNTLIGRNISHSQHKHNAPKSSGHGGHGHSHGDLNMRGIFLHVLGDALGNVGVIATALFIWLTPYSWRFYSDPVISLVITIIILGSAIPLCTAASRILLQAVPMGLDVNDIKADILSLRGIEGCHHLHVWQLSDTKLVASLHIRVAFDFKGEGSQEYMELARQIRRCLHGYGIHSSTIQPEFWCKDVARRRGLPSSPSEPGTEDESCREEDTDSERAGKSCLLDCDDECGDGGQCCGPKAVAAEDSDDN